MRNYQRAVVTGASSGIGECFARQLASQKVHLILVARRTELLENLAKDLRAKENVEVEVFSLDLTEADAPEKLLTFATAQGKTVDLLINNAGNGAYRAFLQTPLEDHLRTLSLNVTAVTRLSHLFGQHMLAHGAPSGILNVASVASFQPIPKFALYCGTKSYVRIFSEIFHFEMKGTNVTVTCLCPGGTETEFLSKNNQKLKTSLSVLQSADDVARIGLRGLAQRKRVIVPGFFNKLQAFLPRLFPNDLNLHIARLGMEIAVHEKDS